MPEAKLTGTPTGIIMNENIGKWHELRAHMHLGLTVIKAFKCLFANSQANVLILLCLIIVVCYKVENLSNIAIFC